MPGFTVPNLPDANYTDQAEPDAVDFEIIGDERFGVYNGGVASQQGTPNMTVALTITTVRVAGVNKTAGATSVTIGAASANPRFDLIAVNGSGAYVVIAGSPDTNPRFPTWDKTVTVMWAVYVPPGTTAIVNELLIDKRRMIHPNEEAAVVKATVAASPDPGYLFLDGTAYPNANTSYPELWAKAPTAWKSGSTLNLPDWREKTLGGYKSGSSTHGALGGSAGANTKTIGSTNLPPHAHTVDPPRTVVRWQASGSNLQLPQYVVQSGTGSSVAAHGSGNSTNEVYVDIASFNSGNGPGTSAPFDVINAAGVVNWQIKAH